MSPRFGIFSQRSVSIKRSNAKVTVLNGTLASLLIALGGRGPLVVRNFNMCSALFGSLVIDCKSFHHYDKMYILWFCIGVTSLVQNSVQLFEILCSFVK
jgi:hypothetical protein